MRRVFLSLPALLILIALCSAPTPSSAGAEAHPLIKRALAASQSARKDLENAAHDYCGHRVEALNATKGAIDQLQQALACAERKGTAVDSPLDFAPESSGPGGERHPNIDRAISALGAAEGDLQNAAHDYCGHRVAALDAVRAALGQLKLAVECDSK